MQLQTYELITDLHFFADVGKHKPMQIGQVVYEWPYPDWGLCGPNDVAVCITPMDVMYVYAVPRSALKQLETVDMTMTVHEGMEHTQASFITPLPAEATVLSTLTPRAEPTEPTEPRS